MLMTIISQTLTLEAFLELPEAKPASEFIDGKMIQKPIPQGEHSLLQGKLRDMSLDLSVGALFSWLTFGINP